MKCYYCDRVTCAPDCPWDEVKRTSTEVIGNTQELALEADTCVKLTCVDEEDDMLMIQVQYV